MCVGLPVMVEEINDGNALVSFDGASRTVSVEFITDLKPGDYVVIHAGIAIAKISRQEAEETIEIMEELYGSV